MRPTILIVDDEPNVRLTYRTALETEGLEVREAADGLAALDAMSERQFDLAILDMRMPEVSGLELLERMRQQGIQTPVVIVTAYGDIPHAVRAMNLGAIDFLEKPLTPEMLRAIVLEILRRHEKPVARRATPKTFEDHVQAAKRLLNLDSSTKPGSISPRPWKSGRILRRSSILAASFLRCSRTTIGPSATTDKPSG
jgi:DNA-binding NtrC family response regulator